ncbi:hypothetical protein M422DRAFT_165687 [Sphaerobolus stellatus SS14]|uniref:RNA helicase n=1 Tax=Sphaerobolus stellatus (strain SS14) TaxID=990650 RepID=A0A0C9VU11_SPHS4|nr:hypothetical protein M422DRAFT_165687 [Sphaerobolus stellatus SS14]
MYDLDSDQLSPGGLITLSDAFSVKEALDNLDINWYNRVTRRSRWMDIIGDYAGEELFLVDGDSLFSIILDDPLLAIGKKDMSFQLIHARYNLERFLNDFKTRNAVFEIVFFEGHKHSTCKTGHSKYVTASKNLARSLMISSLSDLKIPFNYFKDSNDFLWSSYLRERQPMFVLCNDGGEVADQEFAASSTLIQRKFVYDLLTNGIAVASLNKLEFRNAKIFAFIYEQHKIGDPRAALDGRIWDATRDATKMLTAAFPTWDIPIKFSGVQTREDWIRQSLREYLSRTSFPEIDYILAFVFFAHTLLLRNLPLELRAQPCPILPQKLLNHLQEHFLPAVFTALAHFVPTNTEYPKVDLDGRLFLLILRAISGKTVRYSLETIACDIIGDSGSQDLMDFWRSLSGNTEPLAGWTLLKEWINEIGIDAPIAIDYQVSVLPFSHSVLDDFLAKISPPEMVGSAEAVGSLILNSSVGTIFRDTTHWHNSNRPILPKHLGQENVQSTPLDERVRLRRLRREQITQWRLKKLSQSLSGSLGTPLKTLTIPPCRSQNEVKKSSKASVSYQTKKTGKKVITSAEKIRIEADAYRQEKKNSEDKELWVCTLEKIGRMSVADQTLEIRNILRNNRYSAGCIFAEIILYRVDLEFRAWIENERRNIPEVQDTFRVNILKDMPLIAKNSNETISRVLIKILKAIGFYSMSSNILGSTDITGRPKLSFKPVKLLHNDGSLVYGFMELKDAPANWLLRCFGDHMDRSLASQPDDRVDFVPDGWQRKVLDAVDEEKSILVVAPTSAGKTFISYYAMEKILRSSDSSILVYVAPTKALVTQIAAEVSARFNKSGRSCWAVHTRDDRIHDPLTCQILITVPEILSIMLLSPTLAGTWIPRIKRIILDEIHTIGQEVDGIIWEQILLLAPCPIIGLSATIGQPDRFNRWLESIQKAHGFEHVFVEHLHRYSHLRKYIFIPTDKSSSSILNGLDKHRTTLQIHFLHPVSLLEPGTAHKLPPDFALEAADCLTLFLALKKFAKNRSNLSLFQKELEQLDPMTFFRPDRFLRQEDVLRYEERLKNIVTRLIEGSGDEPYGDLLKEVIEDLRGIDLNKSLEDTKSSLHLAPNSNHRREGLIQLLADLHRQNDLPALVFSLDRHECEMMVHELLNQLEDSERRWRDTDPAWKKKVQAWQSQENVIKARKRAADRSGKRKPVEDDLPEMEQSSETSFDPNDPSDNFSFAGIGSSYGRRELLNDLEDLRKWSKTPEWAIAAIQRGIGVHHAGMNKAYRSLVETLFRLGFLRVVIATGTLALGINAPCKTAIFCGDSTYLTALQYRQAAGRAGRRGYDLVGKVVFYGLTYDRVQRLVLSRIPPITGQFPLSTTLCLRMFSLLAGSQNSEFATKTFRSILSLPQISMSSNMDHIGLLHHLRFSIDYLLRAQLLNPNGEPLNLAGLVNHLYYHEPSNLALAALLANGCIHDICSSSSSPQEIRDTLMVILCHLFGRRTLSLSALREVTLEPLLGKYPSRIILPVLPERVAQALMGQSDLIRQVFSGYAMTYVSHNEADLPAKDVLPLTRRSFSGEKLESPLAIQLRETAINPKLRSPFVSTSGHGDLFSTIKELCNESREGLHLSASTIPSFEEIVSPGDTFKLNAYLYDFYRHGQVKSIVEANGIRQGDVWHLLQDFDLTLKTIVASLEHSLKINAKKVGNLNPSEDGEFAEVPLDVEDTYSDLDGPIKGDTAFSMDDTEDEKDRKVYEAFLSLSGEFNTKFRAMWA